MHKSEMKFENDRYKVTGEINADGPRRLVPEGKTVTPAVSVELSEGGTIKYAIEFEVVDLVAASLPASEPAEPVEPADLRALTKAQLVELAKVELSLDLDEKDLKEVLIEQIENGRSAVAAKP